MSLAETFFGKDADLLHDRSFQVLLLGSIVSPLGASVVSPLLDTLTGTYGVSGSEIGLVMAAFTAPSIVAIPLVGALSDRYGRKPVLTAGLALFALAGTALAFTTDFRTVLALRLLQGIGYTGIAPVLIASVGDLYTGNREATAQGLRFTTVGLSLTAFPFLAGLLVAVAWQYPFYLFALGFPAALVVALVFEEPTATADGDESGGGGRESLRQMLRLLRRPRIAATLVGRAVPSFLWFGFLTYNSIIVVRLLGGTPGQAGTLVALASLASSIGATQVGRLTAFFETRRYPLLGGTLACTVGLAVLASAPSVTVAGVGSVSIGGGFGVVLTLYRSLVTGLAPEDLRGTLVSVAESVGRVGSTTAPVVMGAVVAFSRPTLGFDTAVRWTILGVVVFGTVVGVACIVVADRGAAVAEA